MMLANNPFKTHFILFMLALVCFSANGATNKMVTISGTIFKADGKPDPNCSVWFNKDGFIEDSSPKASCDKNGNYSIEIPSGHYNTIYAIDADKYGKTALEFWGWNMELTESQTLDAHYDKIEVYSLSTWVANGPSNSLFAAFRPMLLQNSGPDKSMTLEKHNFRTDKVGDRKLAVLDITPKVNRKSIEGTIDGKPIELLDYFWTYEKSRDSSCKAFPKKIDVSNGCYMPMIVAQFKKPKLEAGKHLLRIRLTDSMTGEFGEGVTHFKSNKIGLGF